VPLGTCIHPEDGGAKSASTTPEPCTMIPALFAFAAALAAAPSAEASDQPARALQLKPKSALTAALAPSHSSAPFVTPAPEPELDLLPRRDERLEQSRSSCAGQNSLCYDPHSGRIVYKPARGFMPEIPGLTRENISVKRDRIVLRYSF
jgi:hypothetical protein